MNMENRIKILGNAPCQMYSISLEGIMGYKDNGINGNMKT
jgi:hypothetical protein